MGCREAAFLIRCFLPLMLPIHPYEQSANGYCGPVCLKMVLGYFGVKKSERELVRLTGATQKLGVDAKGLLKAARYLGFRGLIKDFATFGDIRRYVLTQKIPIIIDWFSVDDGHYAVVVHLNQKRIYLADPEFGRVRSFPLNTFRRVWFDFIPDVPQRKSDFTVRRMIAIMTDQKGHSLKDN